MFSIGVPYISIYTRRGARRAERSESDVGTWECVCLRAQRAREKNGVGLKAGGDFEFKTLKVD